MPNLISANKQKGCYKEYMSHRCKAGLSFGEHSPILFSKQKQTLQWLVMAG